MDFLTKLEKAIASADSLLCVGLDPQLEKLPKKYKSSKEPLFEFSKDIINQTAEHVCTFKPNIAFFETQGIDGLGQLAKTINYLKKNFPALPVILDAKRADMGNTAEAYSDSIFDYWKADAVTVNPYMGLDSVEPFLKRRERGVMVLCRTSNPSSADFQELSINGQPLYIKVAQKAVLWNKKYKNILLVVGATNPEQMRRIRRVASSMTFLVPGIGAQGGDLVKICQNGLTKNGRGLIISASRSIIYAQSPSEEAKKLKDEINKYR
ncbi:MAG: orotidine-5'-phosphate decarboxylase [Candidatus Curtissbacteria bacterium]